MKELNAAYEVLRDPDQRSRYHRLRTEPARATGSASGTTSDSTAGTSRGARRTRSTTKEQFAEWYVWAKREVGSDRQVCLAAAQAAIESLEDGSDEETARRAARRSVAGHGADLLERVTARSRIYAEWYDWARLTIGSAPEAWHRAAAAALNCQEAGGHTAAAQSAAWQASGRAPSAHPPPDDSEHYRATYTTPNADTASADSAPTYAARPRARWRLTRQATVLLVSSLVSYFLLGTTVFTSNLVQTNFLLAHLVYVPFVLAMGGIKAGFQHDRLVLLQGWGRFFGAVVAAMAAADLWSLPYYPLTTALIGMHLITTRQQEIVLFYVGFGSTLVGGYIAMYLKWPHLLRWLRRRASVWLPRPAR
jgi:hypothetical protein